MIPVAFPEANVIYGPPEDMDETQVFRVHAYQGSINKGNLDGSCFVVVAWKPTDQEIQQLQSGQPIYLSMIGGLAPHFITTSFRHAAYFE